MMIYVKEYYKDGLVSKADDFAVALRALVKLWMQPRVHRARRLRIMHDIKLAYNIHVQCAYVDCCK